MEDAKQLVEAVGALQELADQMDHVPLEKKDLEMKIAIQMVCAYALQYADKRRSGVSPRDAIVAIR